MTEAKTTTASDAPLTDAPSCAECKEPLEELWQLDNELFCSEDCMKQRLYQCPECNGQVAVMIDSTIYHCLLGHKWRLCGDHAMRTQSLKGCSCIKEGKVLPTVSDLVKFATLEKKKTMDKDAWNAKQLEWHLKQLKVSSREAFLAQLTDKQLIGIIEAQKPVTMEDALDICLHALDISEEQLSEECRKAHLEREL